MIEEVTGRTYQAYLELEIFRPLAMARSFTAVTEAAAAGLAIGYRPWFGVLQPTEIDYPPSAAPSGYIAATAEDMTHFLIAFLHGGRYGASSVLSEEGITAAQAAIGDTAYGAGWYSGGSYKWHTGELANYNAYICTVPSHELGIVVLSNTTDIGTKFPNSSSSSLRRDSGRGRRDPRATRSRQAVVDGSSPRTAPRDGVGRGFEGAWGGW